MSAAYARVAANATSSVRVAARAGAITGLPKLVHNFQSGDALRALGYAKISHFSLERQLLEVALRDWAMTASGP
jgi:hypothetical protein